MLVLASLVSSLEPTHFLLAVVYWSSPTYWVCLGSRSTRRARVSFMNVLQIPHDPLRSLPVHRVAGLGVDLQGGTGDRRREPLLFFAREEGILLPPQDQRRHIDLTKLELHNHDR